MSPPTVSSCLAASPKLTQRPTFFFFTATTLTAKCQDRHSGWQTYQQTGRTRSNTRKTKINSNRIFSVQIWTRSPQCTCCCKLLCSGLKSNNRAHDPKKLFSSFTAALHIFFFFLGQMTAFSSCLLNTFLGFS